MYAVFFCCFYLFSLFYCSVGQTYGVFVSNQLITTNSLFPVGEGGTHIDSRAAKRFIRSALWEKDKDQGKEKRIKLESEPETS